jgi:hypothetical protein
MVDKSRLGMNYRAVKFNADESITYIKQESLSTITSNCVVDNKIVTRGSQEPNCVFPLETIID